MNLDLRHLRTIRAIHEYGSLSRAAEALFLTQSALSHQIKTLEDQAGQELVVRRAKPARLSAAGLRLLRLADQVLPLIAETEAEFQHLDTGRAGRLTVGTASPASLDWLLPVMDRFRRAWPEVEIDVYTRGTMADLEREDLDLFVDSLDFSPPGLIRHPLFDYSLIAVLAADHPLVMREWLTPDDFAGQTLISYRGTAPLVEAFGPATPAPRHRVDVELTEMILMQVAARRGVALLPEWVLRRSTLAPELAARPFGQGGCIRRACAFLRDESGTNPYMAHFIRLARTETVRMLR